MNVTIRKLTNEKASHRISPSLVGSPKVALTTVDGERTVDVSVPTASGIPDRPG